MFTIPGERHGPDCGGVGRRDFLRLGALGLGGLSLPWLFRQEALAATLRDHAKDKSVVLLFLCGGPSHIETFDPNMDAPAPVCSLTGEVRTSMPGVTFGATFPKIARLAHRLAVVRSYSPHVITDHAKAIRHVLTAGDPAGLRASLGAVAARFHGRSLAPNGTPLFTQLFDKEVDSQYMEDEERMRSSNASGLLGAECAPFDPMGGGEINNDMQLGIPVERLEDRRQLHKALDRFSRALDGSGRMEAFDQFHEQAVQVILGGAVRKALDLSKEEPRLLERYDTSRYETGWLTRSRSTLGRRLLMARRLVEAGCRFVTVGMAGWDNHGNDNHPGVVDGMRRLGAPLDHALSVFLEDVHSRGLDEKLLFVVTGEFGRTTKIQGKGGRDHWPGLCALALAGGGLKTGQVIGRSQRTGDYPATEPIRLENLVATLFHTLFDVGRLRIDPRIPKELVDLVERAEPIRELL